MHSCAQSAVNMLIARAYVIQTLGKNGDLLQTC